MTVQNSKDHVIKFFEDIKDSLDFFRFFDARFECLSDNETTSHLTKVYKVSQDEQLGVQVNSEESPEEIEKCHYSFIFYPKQNAINMVRIFGCFLNDSGITITSHLDKSIANKNLTKLMNSLAHLEQSVNYHLILFGLTDKQRFIFGTLSKWKRLKDGKIVANERITEKLSRRRAWEKRHSPKKIIHYAPEECKKAQCSHLKNEQCEYLMTPNNTDKNSVKLLHAKGYCFDYAPQKLDELKAKLSNIFDKERKTLLKAYQNAIDILEDTPVVEFNHNITAPLFDQRKFSAFISLLNEVTPNQKPKLIKKIKTSMTELTERIDTIISLGEDVFVRLFTKKGYKKAQKEFEQTRDDLRIDIHYKLDKVNRLTQELITRNALIKELFTGKHGYLSIHYDHLQEGMTIYFRTSSIKEKYGFRSKTNEYFNMGRTKDDSGNWTDKHLTLPHFFYSPQDKFSEIPEYPLYKVVSVKKSHTTLQEFTTNQEIKLISTRKYSPYILYYHNAYLPEIKSYTQPRVYSYFLRECLYSLFTLYYCFSQAQMVFN